MYKFNFQEDKKIFMNKNIFIYGGLYKTASEFLNEKYFENLDKEKFTIFSSYKKKNREIYKNFLKILSGEITLKEGKQQIHKEVQKAKTPNIIIQSTGFFAHRYTAHHDVEKRFKLLEDIFLEPKYIIILRDQKTSIYSQWHAGLKKRVKLTFSEYTDADINFLSKQSLPHCKEVTNYRCFDYNQILKSYIKLLNQDKNRLIFLIYEELKQDPKSFFNKLNIFLMNENLKFEIDFSFKNKTNSLEETNLKCFLFFKNTHVLILNLLYIYFKILKIAGFDTNIKPPYKNYKFEKTLNSISLKYLNFVEKVVFRYFFKEKNSEYEKKKEIRKIEIENFYKEKNEKLEKNLNLNLKKYKYF